MGIALWPMLLACVTAGTAVARERSVESSATVRRLHETMVKPASDVVFEFGREEPMSEEKWAAMSSAGVTLVKSGNLLRLASPTQGRARWVALCRQLAAAGRVASAVAETRNVAGLMRTSDRLVAVCETCHASYRK